MPTSGRGATAVSSAIGPSDRPVGATAVRWVNGWTECTDVLDQPYSDDGSDDDEILTTGTWLFEDRFTGAECSCDVCSHF